jgi:glutathione synthase/RimK-type ligase-like ATP-grasp enzyme
MKILLVGESTDAHIVAVDWALKKMGYRPVIWSWRDFPRYSCSLKINTNSGTDTEIRFSNELASGPFDVIWNRRVAAPVPLEDSCDFDKPVIVRESTSMLKAMMRQLGHPGTRWVNDFDSAIRAADKVLQLSVAKESGFEIPDTLLSNDPEVVHDFYARHNKRVIFKGFNPAGWVKSDGGSVIMKTSLLTDAVFDDKNSIKQCPGIFQALINKKFEVRVTVMGNSAVSARLDSQKSGACIDWRYDVDQSELPISMHKLPDDVEAKCIAVCKKLGLEFGCIDLIFNDKNEYVFLEVNQAGQFLWKEGNDSEIPVLNLFCNFLVGQEGRKNHCKEFTLEEFDKAFEDARWVMKLEGAGGEAKDSTFIFEK